jgi:hypothetical protein
VVYNECKDTFKKARKKMNAYLIVYSEVRENEILATFHTIERYNNQEEAINIFKRDNQRFHYEIIAIRKLKDNERIFL